MSGAKNEVQPQSGDLERVVMNFETFDDIISNIRSVVAVDQMPVLISKVEDSHHSGSLVLSGDQWSELVTEISVWKEAHIHLFK